MGIQNLIFYILGGIAIFLFGIKFLSEGLQKITGDRIRHLLATYTVPPLLGVVTGIFITTVFQSATGAVILIIGLLNASILSLRQAVHVLIGANIGTIVTIFIVGFRIEDYALPIIAVGVLLWLFGHYKRIQYIGQIILGFGALFLGLSFVRDALRSDNLSQDLTMFLLNLADFPMFGLLVGIMLSLLLTSSNAAIGVLQTVADEGVIDLAGALPILLGSNIGTAIIACIAVFGASIKAKRLVLIDVVYYVFGAILFLILQKPLLMLMTWLEQLTYIKVQLAIAHSLFHLLTGLICLVLVPLLLRMANDLIQTHQSTTEVWYGTQYLDKRFLATPSVALGQAQHEVLRMGGIARETLAHAAQYFFEQDSRSANQALKKEALINELNQLITDYIVSIHQHDLTAADSEKLTSLLHIVNDIERIGDHAENIVELADYCVNNRVQFSEQAISQLHQMIDAADWIIGRALYALEQNDRSAAADVLGSEADLDRMELEFRNDHFKRLNDNLCRGNAGAIFLDVLSNLERVGDHSKNIAEYVLK